jgi:Glycosyl hydrolases family 16
VFKGLNPGLLHIARALRCFSRHGWPALGSLLLALALSALGTRAAAQAEQLLGPGTNVNGYRSYDNGDRLNVAVAPSAVASVGAGTYRVTRFAFETGASSGAVRPFLATLSTSSPVAYEVVWVGAAVSASGHAVGDVVTTSYSDQTFNVPAANNLYAGFFTASGGRVALVIDGGHTDHSSTFTPFSTANRNPSGPDITGFGNPNLGRSYSFLVGVSAGAANTDAGTVDAGVADTGVADAGVADTGVADTGVADTGVADTGVADTGVADTGVADAGVADTGVADAGVADSGAPDAGSGVTSVVGPGVGLAGYTDLDNGDRLNVAAAFDESANLAAGTYAVSSFSFENGARAGSVVPFLAAVITTSPPSYRVLWLGAAVSGASSNPGSTVSASYANEAFTLSSTTRVYAGFYTSNGGRVLFVGGESTDHSSNVPTVTQAQVSAGTAVLSSFTNPGLNRAYQFEIDIRSSGGGTDAGTPDAGSDAGIDAGADAGTDAGADAGLDAGNDAGSDAGIDAGSDAGTDAGSDAGTDAGSDAGTDAGSDAGTDAGSDAGTVFTHAGPGTAYVGSPAIDNGDRLNVATSGTAVSPSVPPGSYSVSDFSFETGSSTGTVRPFLAQLVAPNSYEVVWVGPAAAAGGAAVNSVLHNAYGAGAQSFTVTSSGPLFGGFYTASGGRVNYVGGGSTDHASTFTPFSAPNSNLSGADLANFSNANLGRSYRFRISFNTSGATNPPPSTGLDSDKPVTLDLTGYHLTFSDEFDGPLNISNVGPGTKWIAHTPYNGDFGDAYFTDPANNPSPFATANGLLTITARYDQSVQHWRSGLIASVDTQGNGYSLQYGYVEMRAKFPQGPGTWPAFWMVDRAHLQGASVDGSEIDIVEQYGHLPQALTQNWHVYFTNGTSSTDGAIWTVEDMTTAFHTYGFMWDDTWMVWYFDGKEMWRLPTLPQVKQPLFLMVNLALGAGYPINQTPDPSVMYVDYVRAYQKN